MRGPVPSPAPLPDRTDVLVVGGGPAGLATACSLRMQGVDVVVVDRGDRAADTSRAAVVHARTLEVLEGIGVADEVVRTGIVVPTFTMRDRSRLLASVDFGVLATPYPFTVMLPQSRTEEILRRRLEGLGGEVRQHHELTALRPSRGGGSVATVEHTAAGTGTDTLHCTADYVVGADGSRSAVRDLLGIPFPGAAYEPRFALADIELRWSLPPDEVQLFASPAGLLVVAPLPDGRHRVVATTPRTATDDPPGLPEVQLLLDTRGPGGAEVRQVHWSSRFAVAHRLAATFARGPAFLVGDAAHVHSPAGCQGMNLGIQDAVDLASRLAGALRGEDGKARLDRFASERRVRARQIVNRTDRMTRAATASSRWVRLARNSAVAALVPRPTVNTQVARRLAQLDG